MGVLNGGNSSVAQREGGVSGCSAKGKLKVGSSTKASASMKCPKSVWEELGFTAAQVEKIETILGTTKIKFGYKASDSFATARRSGARSPSTETATSTDPNNPLGSSRVR